MSTLLSLALLMAAAPGDVSSLPTAPSAAKSAAPIYTGRELDQAVHAALRRWARPSKAEVEPAARALLALYENVRKDRTLAFVTRKQLTATLRYRLAALVRQMDGDDAQPASVTAAKVRGVLAQRAGGLNQNPAPGGAAGQDDASYGDLAELIQSVIAPASWERAGGLGTIRGWKR
jgi:hypothetical protein